MYMHTYTHSHLPALIPVPCFRYKPLNSQSNFLNHINHILPISGPPWLPALFRLKDEPSSMAFKVWCDLASFTSLTHVIPPNALLMIFGHYGILDVSPRDQACFCLRAYWPKTFFFLMAGSSFFLVNSAERPPLSV